MSLSNIATAAAAAAAASASENHTTPAVIQQIKLKILDVIDYVIDVRLDYRITQTLALYKAKVTQPPPPLRERGASKLRLEVSASAGRAGCASSRGAGHAANRTNCARARARVVGDARCGTADTGSPAAGASGAGASAATSPGGAVVAAGADTVDGTDDGMQDSLYVLVTARKVRQDQLR